MSDAQEVAPVVCNGVELRDGLGLPGLPFELIGLAIILTVRGRDSAAWLGIAMVIMTPSIHDYGFLFVLPGLLTSRRDLAIPLAAFFLGYYHTYAWYIGIMILAYILIASRRWDWMRAPAIPCRRPRSTTDSVLTGWALWSPTQWGKLYRPPER